MAHHHTSFHGVCRWTFHAGKGGFVPGSIRPEWDWDKLDTAGVVRLIKKEIAPRMPTHVQLGFEVHYNTEVDERTAAAVADALGESQIYLGMITPGAHSHFGYGGIASLDPGPGFLSLFAGESRHPWIPSSLKVRAPDAGREERAPPSPEGRRKPRVPVFSSGVRPVRPS